MSKVCPLAIAICLISTPASAGVLNVTQFNSPLAESFDSLAAVGTAGTLPAGWGFSETGTSANATYTAGTGSSATGDTYSFGASGSADRAFGTLQTGSLSATLTLSLTNATPVTLTQLGIAYTGEQWRLGALGRSDRLDFAFSVDGASWIDVDELDFVAPNATGTVGALDGNAAGNRVALSHSLTGLGIASGQSFWLRWTDFGAAGSDDGLGVDNFSLTALQPVSPPAGSAVPDSLPAFWSTAALGAVVWLGRGKHASARR